MAENTLCLYSDFTPTCAIAARRAVMRCGFAASGSSAADNQARCRLTPGLSSLRRHIGERDGEVRLIVKHIFKPTSATCHVRNTSLPTVPPHLVNA